MASNLSQNYEKVVLAFALVVALGLGTLVYLKAGKLEDQFQTPVGDNFKAPPLPGMVAIGDAIDNLGMPAGSHAIAQGTVEGSRKVDLLTGIPWFVQREGQKPVDLGNPKEPAVHEGIPNIWWIENDIDPGFADSPLQDPDKDGFTNGEEYLAKTDPNDAKSYGDLSTKIRLVELIKEPHLLRLSSEAGKTYKFQYEDRFTGRRRQVSSQYIPAGEDDKSIFFDKEPVKGKFKLLSVERKNVIQESTGTEVEELFATVEVLTGSKIGTQYVVPKRNRQFVVRNYKANLVLAAIGEEGNNFEVEENTRFSLPHDPAATDKPFLFKGVENDADVVIEWQKDGETKQLILKP